MPVITIQTAGQVTAEQKKTISQKVTDIVCSETGKNPEKCYVIFDEVDRENFAIAGKMLK